MRGGVPFRRVSFTLREVDVIHMNLLGGLDLNFETTHVQGRGRGHACMKPCGAKAKTPQQHPQTHIMPSTIHFFNPCLTIPETETPIEVSYPPKTMSVA